MRYVGIITVLVITTLLLFYSLGDNALSHWDEAWYADVSRTMLRTGNYFTPVWNGHPFFDKPPLFYWVTAFSMKLFGVGEWSIRAVSAVAGVGTVLITYLLAQRLFSNRSMSLISAMVLASTIAFLFRSRTGNLDTFLTFWLTLGMYAIYTKRRLVLVIAIIAAFLTKWFIAFLFPILFILRSRSHVKSVGIALLFAIAWIAIYTKAYGQPFLDEFWFNQYGKVAPGAFSFDYILYLKSGLKLWFIFLIPAIYLARKLPISIYIFLIIFGLSFSANKSDWFLMPLYPLIAIVIGFMMRRWIIVVVAIAVFHITYYGSLYIPADTAADDAAVAKVAKARTLPGDKLYVTNYLIPTIAYYSQRQTYAVYGNRRDPNSPWILPQEDWQRIKENPRVFVITNFGELEQLKKDLAPHEVEMLYQSGDKLLVGKRG